MFIDARELETGTVIDADVCIIGAGPAGVAMAREFLNRRLNVVLLEAGGPEETPASQDFFAGENVGLPYEPAGTRFRMYGGSGARWGGYTAPLDPGDFAAHDHIPASGWPIDLTDLAPFYARSLNWMDLDERAFDPEFLASLGDAIVRFPEGTVLNKIWHIYRFRYGAVMRDAFEAATNLKVLLHAPVTGMPTNEARDHVQTAIVQPAPDLRLQVRARRFVIACGGLETPRLLLTAGPDFTPLVVNDNIGRYFQEHFHVYDEIKLALYGPPARSELYEQCGEVDDCCETRAFFQLAPEVRRRYGLTNVAFKVHHDTDPDPVGAVAGSLANHLAARDDLVRLGSVSVMAEQAPNRISRVSLADDERDALGVPRLRLAWRSTALDNDSIFRSAHLLSRYLGETSGGRLRLLPELEKLEFTNDFGGFVRGGAHHMGTTRMSTTPADGVVDADCRIHGLDNCYVAGSAVFPTSGCANPTLTIMALAMRLSDHLAADLGGDDAPGGGS